MRQLMIAIALLAAACTKPNPDRCCTDAADCSANDIPVTNTCSDGMTCTNHECVTTDQCTTASECSTAMPYCSTADSGSCEATCTVDGECPGFSQGSDDTFCVGGACVECRADMSDCPTTAPICFSGACGACTSNDQCPSEACAPNGTCVDESQIAYVDGSAGVATGKCPRSAPCITLDYALTTTAPYIVIAAGSYSVDGTFSVAGPRTLIGTGARTVLVRADHEYRGDHDYRHRRGKPVRPRYRERRLQCKWDPRPNRHTDPARRRRDPRQRRLRYLRHRCPHCLQFVVHE